MRQQIEEGDRVRIRNSLFDVVALTYGDNVWVIPNLNHNQVWLGLGSLGWPHLEKLSDCTVYSKGQPVVVTGGN